MRTLLQALPQKTKKNFLLSEAYLLVKMSIIPHVLKPKFHDHFQIFVTYSYKYILRVKFLKIGWSVSFWGRKFSLSNLCRVYFIHLQTYVLKLENRV